MTPLDDPRVVALIRSALEEDHVREDLTTRALVPDGARAAGTIVAREAGRFSGAFLLDPSSPLREAFPDLEVEELAAEGRTLAPGDPVARLRGGAASLLAV